MTSPLHQACPPSTPAPASFHTLPINRPLSNPATPTNIETPVHSTMPVQCTPTSTTLSNAVHLTQSNQHISPS